MLRCHGCAPSGRRGISTADTEGRADVGWTYAAAQPWHLNRFRGGTAAVDFGTGPRNRGISTVGREGAAAVASTCGGAQPWHLNKGGQGRERRAATTASKVAR